MASTSALATSSNSGASVASALDWHLQDQPKHAPLPNLGMVGVVVVVMVMVMVMVVMVVMVVVVLVVLEVVGEEVNSLVPKFCQFVPK